MASGNTFGVKFFSDGFMLTPMMMIGSTKITVYLGCEKFYWIDEAEEVDIIRNHEKKPEWDRAIKLIPIDAPGLLLHILSNNICRNTDD